MSYAYTAKAAAEVTVEEPDGWPSEWDYPGPPWPPGWPLDDWDGSISLSVDAGSSTLIGSTTSLICRCLTDGADDSDFLYHAIKVTATLNGAVVNLKKEVGDAFSASVYFLASNYTGSRYGFSDTIILNVNSGNDGGVATITCTLVTVDPEITGTDTTTLTGVPTWTSGTAAEANAWEDIEWAPSLGIFCAVAVNGTNRVMTSTDGSTWTARAASAVKTWAAICWAEELTLFVATSADGAVMTSPNGITWTTRTASSAAAWEFVVYSPELNLFCAASSNSAVAMTSPDGITWTGRTTANSAHSDIAWSPELGLFVLSGNSAMESSPDGINWTSRTAANVSNSEVAWSPELGLFACVGNSGSNSYSTNGTTWTAGTAPGSTGNCRGLAWSPELGLFMAVCNSGTNRVMSSPDGINWTAGTAAAASGWFAVDWSPALGKFSAVALSGATRVMTAP